MASLKEIKERINSVSSTRKITSAMKMISSAKLHKAQAAILNMHPYAQTMHRTLEDLLSAGSEVNSALAAQRPVKRVAIVAFSSDTSLCGAFNMNVIKELRSAVRDYRSLGLENILLWPIGKEVADASLKMGLKPVEIMEGAAGKPEYAPMAHLAQTLMQMFLNGMIDRVELIYHHFKSAGSQQLVRQTMLPMQLASQRDMTANNGEKPVTHAEVDYLLEPSRERLLEVLIPKVLKLQLFTALLDSNASEHAARVIAMQTATENADELIGDLKIQYNKSRQQAITNELLDIVGGSMA